MGASNKKLTTAEFIERAHTVHGERYDYSRAVYEAGKSKVKIGCPEHGLFEQQPTNHVMGQGCPKCGRAKTEAAKRSTSQAFVARARLIHGERYDYSQVLYTTCKLKVNIICPTHGQFSQEAYSHLMGVGCPRCGREVVEAASRKSTTWFIDEAKAIHGNFYDYALAEYASTHKKVKIGCPQHGIFEQSPAGHIHQKQGCPKCYKEAKATATQLSWIQQANGRSGTLYFVRLFDCQEEFYKVGVTYHSVGWRYRSKSRRANYGYEVLAQYTSANPVAIHGWEQSILRRYSHLGYKPIRQFDGASECFSSAEEILAIFPL